MKKAFKCLLPLFLLLLIMGGCKAAESAEKTVSIEIHKKTYWTRLESESIIVSADESFQNSLTLAPDTLTDKILSYTATIPGDTKRLYVRPPTALITRMIGPVSVTLQKSAPVMLTMDGDELMSVECAKGEVFGRSFLKLDVMSGGPFIAYSDFLLTKPDGGFTSASAVSTEDLLDMEGRTADLWFTRLPEDFDYDGCTLTVRAGTERVTAEPKSDDIELIIMP